MDGLNAEAAIERLPQDDGLTSVNLLFDMGDLQREGSSLSYESASFGALFDKETSHTPDNSQNITNHCHILLDKNLHDTEDSADKKENINDNIKTEHEEAGNTSPLKVIHQNPKIKIPKGYWGKLTNNLNPKIVAPSGPKKLSKKDKNLEKKSTTQNTK